VVYLNLVGARYLKRNRFVEMEHRSAVQSNEGHTEDPEVDDHLAPLLVARCLRRGNPIVAKAAFREIRNVELCSFTSVSVEPETDSKRHIASVQV
jgi:hypothetical protein